MDSQQRAELTKFIRKAAEKEVRRAASDHASVPRRTAGRAGSYGENGGIRMKRGRAGRLVAGMLALAGLALLLSQAVRLPGPAGAALRRNAADGRDAAAAFYTEVDGWRKWTAGGPARAAAPSDAPAPRTRRGVTP